VLIPFVLLALATCGKDVVEVIPSNGVIEVTALAEGAGPFPDRFGLTINGGSSGTIEPNGVVAFSSLPRGDYYVALSGEGDDCFYGETVRRVTVEPNDTSFVTFLIRCGAR